MLNKPPPSYSKAGLSFENEPNALNRFAGLLDNLQQQQQQVQVQFGQQPVQLHQQFQENSIEQDLQAKPQQVSKYIKPRPFPHKNGAECQYDHFCHENECRILQKLCCHECAPYVHPNHSIDTIEWFFNHEKEKMKRKEGIHKTTLHEISEQIVGWRKTRMKYWKWSMKQFKKIERECRAVEDFTKQKINASLSSSSRKEAYQKLIQLVKHANHPKLNQLRKTNPEFDVKQEDYTYNEPLTDTRSDYAQIVDVVDRLFLADEREKEKILSSKQSPSPQRAIRNMKFISEKWERMIHKVMGANKRFSKKMLNESRMSVRTTNNNKLKIQVVDVNIQLPEDEAQGPKVLQVLFISTTLLLTVHPNEIRLWKFNSNTFSDIKPITGLKLLDLKHVTVSEKRGEFLLLHGQQEIWAINQKNTAVIARVYKCPISDLTLSRIQVSTCETMLFSSGGCRQNGFYIVCWIYANSEVLRIIRHQYSFPHEGDLLVSYTHQHLFRCNRNSVDVFNLIEGTKTQTISLPNIRDCIYCANILKNFQGSDSLSLSTNKGSFFIYSYDDRFQLHNYRLVHSMQQGGNSIFHVFYQCELADEGFFIALLENNETRVYYQDLNNKQLLKGIEFKDQVLCGKLDYQRNPWRNQLQFVLGFESGLLRVIKLIKVN